MYFPTNYPHEKADFKLKETHRFFHPNISRITGNICSKIVTSGQISLQIRDRVNAFIILLSEPNPEDGFNNEATAMYNRDKCEYFRTAFKMFRGLQPWYIWCMIWNNISDHYQYLTSNRNKYPSNIIKINFNMLPKKLVPYFLRYSSFFFYICYRAVLISFSMDSSSGVHLW